MKQSHLLIGALTLVGATGVALAATPASITTSAAIAAENAVRPILPMPFFRPAHGIALFKRADANLDGSVTRAEVGRALNQQEALMLNRLRARTEARFAKVDTNNDGALSVAELAAARNAAADDAQRGERGRRGPGGPGGGGMMRLFDMADTNRDGDVTQAEFRVGADRIFAALDTNHDGTVTALERKAMDDQIRARREAGGGGWGDRRGPDGPGPDGDMQPPPPPEN